MKKITVLGSSGSIGKQALDVIDHQADSMELFGLSVKQNTALLIEQACRFHPRVVASERAFDPSLLPKGTEALFGSDAAERLAGYAESDVVVNGISGFAALSPLLAALYAGKRVALANKESIVCGSTLVDAAVEQYGGEILPVDSEQSAIFQCLQNGRREEIDKLILTASGGPFWQRTRNELASITPEQALRHPTWSMGRKITIDSATLFNKGLEVIEAGYLFHMDADQIDVLIHPQSIVHSMVSYRDGTTIANMSFPDMRLPIQYAITYPERTASVCRPLSLTEGGTLTFHAVDRVRFSAIAMAYDTLRAGGSYPIAYNGANEAAVQAFCDRRIGFMDIDRTVDYTLQHHRKIALCELADIYRADAESRAMAETYMDTLSNGKRENV
ncbi:MAG: 1-deoxy-D-xylulose-5-phosphate reductoisomerase [Clostridia bacterium]